MKIPDISKRYDITYSVGWNLFLITLGTLIFIIGAKGIAVPHNFIPGGLFGMGTLLYYVVGFLDPGQWFLLLNVPIFAIAWVKVSRRFCFYSLYAMLITSSLYSAITVNIELHNQLYAAVASGMICGIGAGIVLRSLGSCGGLDVVAVYLFQKYNIGIGKFYIFFNCILFLSAAFHLNNDLIVASLIMVFITSTTMEYMLSMFNQRKVVFIISDNAEAISADILRHMKQSATFLKGFGAYTRKEKNVLMTVVNNVQLKRLEELVFTADPYSLFIVENTFSVLGSSFSRRKIY